MGTYTEWKLGDASVGGMMDISGRVPDEVPAHWLVYFAVADADAAVEKIRRAGGAVHFGPVDIPAGRFAVVADPAGVGFAVIKIADDRAQRLERRRFGRVAGLALVLPFGGLAEGWRS